MAILKGSVSQAAYDPGRRDLPTQRPRLKPINSNKTTLIALVNCSIQRTTELLRKHYRVIVRWNFPLPLFPPPSFIFFLVLVVFLSGRKSEIERKKRKRKRKEKEEKSWSPFIYSRFIARQRAKRSWTSIDSGEDRRDPSMVRGRSSDEL